MGLLQEGNRSPPSTGEKVMNSGGQVTPSVSATAFLLAGSPTGWEWPGSRRAPSPPSSPLRPVPGSLRIAPDRPGPSPRPSVRQLRSVEVSTDLQDLTPLGSAGSRGQISGSGDRKGLGYALGPILGGVLISVGGYAPHTRVRPRRRADSRLVPPMVLMKCALSLDAAS
jgi:hypothetical protein